MVQFEVGKQYVVPASNNLQYPIKIVKRTPKFVYVQTKPNANIKRCRIEIFPDRDGIETEAFRYFHNLVTASWEW